MRTLVCVTLLMLLHAHGLALPDPAGLGPSAQDTLVRVVLNDGTELIGRIISQDAATIDFMTTGGLQVQILRSMVKEIEPLEGEVRDGEYRRIDPNGTRLFFGPTARPLKSGRGYFSAYEIFLASLAIGIGDVFSMAGGMSLLPGAEQQLFFLAPRIFASVGSSVDVAAGLLYGGVTGEEDNAGIVYGVTTVGSPYVSLTLGLGYGFSGDDFAEDPIILAGFEAQLSSSVKFISENWIVVGSDVIPVSFGIRFFGDHLAADFAFFYPLGSEEMEGFPFVPWIGFAYNFDLGN